MIGRIPQNNIIGCFCHDIVAVVQFICRHGRRDDPQGIVPVNLQRKALLCVNCGCHRECFAQRVEGDKGIDDLALVIVRVDMIGAVVADG